MMKNTPETKLKTWKEKRNRMVKSHISLEAVYSYVKNYEYPPGTSELDKRSIRKRAKSFSFIGKQFVYIPEKSQKLLDDGAEVNIEPRRVLLKEEKRRQAVWKAHVDEQGNHLGMEKTTAAVTKMYYWMGISNLVREIIRDCAVCRVAKAACGTTGTMPILTSEIKTETNEDEELESFVPFHSMRIEVATSFWQKVDIQILGPFAQGKSTMYVVMCLDRYSLWTEGAVIPTLSSAAVTHVVLNLVCRFGCMQNLFLRENDRANRKTVEIREDLFQKAGLDIKLVADNASETAPMWKVIEEQVKAFTEQHPKCWSQCLDLCLLPLRISRPDAAEYTPDFLVYNREIPLPQNLSHRPENFDVELHLSASQMTTTTEILMNIYNGFCQAFPYSIPKLTLTRKLSSTPEVQSKTNVAVVPLTTATCTVTTTTSQTSASSSSKSAVTEATTASITSPTSSVSEKSGASSKSEEQISPRKVVTRYGRVSIPTPGMILLMSGGQGASGKETPRKVSTRRTDIDDEVDEEKEEEYTPPVKRSRPGRPRKEKKTNEKTSESRSSTKQEPDTTQESYSLDKMEDLDTYYAALKQYIKLGTYHAGSTVHQKRVIRKVSKNYIVEDDVMYYIQESKGKSTKKMVVMTLLERIDLLKAAHVLEDGSHVCKQKIVQRLEEQNKYWKGLTLDAYAFTRACQTCDHGRERLRDFSYLKDDEEEEEEDEDISDEETQEESYDDLVNYMKFHRYPKDSTPNQKSTIRKRSKNFAYVNDELHYVLSKSADTPPRKVLFTEAERLAAIKQAHSANHWGINKTMVNVREKAYWSGMTADCHSYLKKCKQCCRRLMTSSLQDVIKKKKSQIEERVKKFQELFVAKILEMDKIKEKELTNISETLVKIEQDVLEETTPPHASSSEETPGDRNIQQSAPSGEMTTLVHEQTTPASHAVLNNVEHTYSVIRKPGTDELLVTKSVISNPESEQTQTADDRQVSEVTLSEAQPDDGQLKLEEELEITVTFEEVTGEQLQICESEMKGQETMVTERGDPQEQDVRNVASKKQKYKCDYCGCVIKGLVSYKYHVFKHTGVKPFQCEVCPKTFTNNKSCKMHMRKHTGEKPFLCNLCGKSFSRAPSLQYHLKAHSAGGGVPVKCDVCQRMFTTMLRMQKHMKCKHPEHPPVFKCVQCDKVFTAARSLKRHQASHQGIRHYQCQVCGRSFFRKEYLNSHMQQHPEAGPAVTTTKRKKISQYQCHYCGQVFANDSYLNNHLIEDHEAGSIVIITSDNQMKKHEVDLSSYSGQNFGQGNTGHQQQQTEEGGAQEEAIQSIVQAQDGSYELTQDTVEYEVECLTSESLTEADFKAIHILAQASLHTSL